MKRATDDPDAFDLAIDELLQMISELTDYMCSIPPLCWLDRLLNAFVGPSR